MVGLTVDLGQEVQCSVSGEAIVRHRKQGKDKGVHPFFQSACCVPGSLGRGLRGLRGEEGWAVGWPC